MDDLDTKSIWLKKDGRIVGLHAIGYKELYEFTFTHEDGRVEEMTTDFVELEKWGNEYDENFKMIGIGSFRVFDLTLDHAAKEFEEDGWERFKGPGNKEEKEYEPEH